MQVKKCIDQLLFAAYTRAMPPQAMGPALRPGEWIERIEIFFRSVHTGGMGMSQDPGQWESQTANQESLQKPDWTPEKKAELQRKLQDFRKRRSQVANHQEGQQKSAWAHWEYTPDEWAQLDRMDWGRAVQRYWFTAVLGTLSFLASIAFLFWLAVVAPGPGSFGIMALVPLLMLLFYCVVPSKAFHKARKRHRARKNASQPQKGTLASQVALRYNAEYEVSQPYKVTLSGQGLWMAGTYFPLAGRGVEAAERSVMLREVRLSTQPTMLHFRVDHDVAHFSSSTGLLYSYHQEIIPLLVPAGHESEAEQIVHRYRTEVVVSRKSERQRQRAAQEAREHPPEPD